MNPLFLVAFGLLLWASNKEGKKDEKGIHADDRGGDPGNVSSQQRNSGDKSGLPCVEPITVVTQEVAKPVENSPEKTE